MAELPKLYFVFPHRGVGGVSLLFLRAAEELARGGQAACTLVDYPDGFMASHRTEGLTKLAAYADDGIVAIPADAVAIFQSMTPWSIYPGVRPDASTRLLFWNCHPFNLVPTFPGLRAAMQSRPTLTQLALGTALRSYRSVMRRFAALLLDRRSLVFMDRQNLETTQRFLALDIPDPVMLSVGAVPAAPRAMPAPTHDGVMRAAWIGRIVDFKYPILERTLKELDRVVRAGTRIAMTVVGAGEYSDRLRRLVRDMRLPVTLIDHMPADEMDRFLREEVDLLLAMGTSALEGAKFGVPTILLDMAYAAVPDDYRFEWLADRDGSTLADHIDLRRLGQARSLDQRIDELSRDPHAVAARTLAYFNANHAMPAIAERLAALAGLAQCRWRDLQAAGLVRRGVIYRVFRAIKQRLGST